MIPVVQIPSPRTLRVLSADVIRWRSGPNFGRKAIELGLDLSYVELLSVLNLAQKAGVRCVWTFVSNDKKLGPFEANVSLVAPVEAPARIGLLDNNAERYEDGMSIELSFVPMPDQGHR